MCASIIGQEHVAVYQEEPAVEDVINRGQLEYGKRIETITYVPARAGEYQLPDIGVSWWDIGSKQLRTENLPGISIAVTALAAAAMAEIARCQRRRRVCLLPAFCEESPPWQRRRDHGGADTVARQAASAAAPRQPAALHARQRADRDARQRRALRRLNP